MEKERLQFCINRFDHYFDSINNKSSVYLAMSTFITGVLIAFYSYCFESIDITIFIHILMFFTILLGLMQMMCVVWASMPFLSKETNSLLYFSSVRRLGIDEFKTHSIQLSLESELDDLRHQTHNLAKGLSIKFKILKAVSVFFLVQLFLLLPLFYLVIINHKIS